MSRSNLDDGGPAFPQDGGGLVQHQKGMLLRDWFATHAPPTSQESIKAQIERDRAANPHGDSYKPQRRSMLEIECDLRYAYADGMIAARKREPTKI